jgi:hypothetical protein
MCELMAAQCRLHLAAQQGDLDTLYRLLDHPDDRTTTAADPDAQGITPLHSGGSGSVACVGWLAISALRVSCSSRVLLDEDEATYTPHTASESIAE